MIKKERFLYFYISIFLTLLFFLGPVTGSGEDKPLYPQYYRGWHHVKSMLIYDAKHPLFNPFGGIHHIYVNKTGLEAYRKGGTFPDGTIIVFDLLEAKDENGTYVEGQRKLIGVMYKDLKKFKETGGWGFDAFEKDTKNSLVKDGGVSCYNCHLSQKERDFVFSKYRP